MTTSGTEGVSPDERSVKLALGGRFVLDRALGKGASGTVYKVHDERLGMAVAVKMLTAMDPGSLFRFKSEFRVLANLTHRNLLQLYELINYQEDWFLTMELVEGSNFLSYVCPQREPATPNAAENSAPNGKSDGDTVVTATQPSVDELSDEDTEITQTQPPVKAPGVRAAGPSSPPANDVVVPEDQGALSVLPETVTSTAWPVRSLHVEPCDEARLRFALLQLCEGLQALHRAQRLHRDIKPANVLVASADERVVICDFGLALEGRNQADLRSSAPVSAASSRFESRQREIAGTVPYMSPEQAKAGTLTPASDWYSVGVMVYQALTGHLPFNPRLDFRDALEAKLHAPIVHPCDLAPGVSRDLADLALALLAPNPERRAGYAEIMAVLERTGADHARGAEHGFIGRGAELHQLVEAYEMVGAGSPCLALVSGAAGLGKTTLVNRFLAQLAARENALILRARCYEREEVPYKALDPLVDSLSTYLMGLRPERAAELIPPSVRYLAAMFPALRRVPAVVAVSEAAPVLNDPSEGKRQAFGALRELCRRLAEQRRLVLSVDDLQWGDLDSAPMFPALLSPPHAPAVLIVGAYRSEDEHRGPLLAQLGSAQLRGTGTLRSVHVSLDTLKFADAERLALALLRDRNGDPKTLHAAREIAREAEGNPLLIQELAAHFSLTPGRSSGTLRVQRLIDDKLARLTSEQRVVLSLVALAGRPVQRTTLRSALAAASSGTEQAAAPGAVLFKALRELEKQRLITTFRMGGSDRVECSQGRTRQAALQLLSTAESKNGHRVLGLALESESSKDYDALFEHWNAAGEVDKARGYALQGAQQAEEALAFGRAVDLYRKLLAISDGDARALRERLGRALMLAGRGAEAASVYQELIAGAPPSDALRFRMLSITQRLRTGELEAGFEELEQADDLFGVRFPRTTTGALSMLLFRRGRLAFKTRNIVLGATESLSAERSERLDALWEVAAAVTNADFLRGSVYGAEMMLRAIASRDPAHIAGACGLDAVNAACGNKPQRVEAMLAAAEEAALRTERDDVLGRVRGLATICRQLQGRWRDAVRLASNTVELLNAGARINWDLAIVIWWKLTSVACIGDIGDLVTQIPEALRDAEARGDVYAATEFRTHRSTWAWLGIDDPDVADAQVDIAERDWTPPGYQFQHWHMLFSRSEIDLYRATPQRSFERLSQEWGRARFLRQVQGVRADMRYTRARLALALVAGSQKRTDLIRMAITDGRALVAERVPWIQALGRLVLAGAASHSDVSMASQMFEEVEKEFEAVDMRLHAQVARLRRGQVADGAAGQTLIDGALAAANDCGVKHPLRFFEMLLPAAARL